MFYVAPKFKLCENSLFRLMVLSYVELLLCQISFTETRREINKPEIRMTSAPQDFMMFLHIHTILCDHSISV